MKISETNLSILAEFKNVNKHFKKFFEEIVLTIVSCKGKINFRNLSRWTEICEKTIRRNFSKSFDFVLFNYLLICKFVSPEICVIAIDCSFIKKSGDKTFGLDKFWSGCLQKALKGLEISVISIVDLTINQAFNLSVEQTPSTFENQDTRIDFYLLQIKSLKEKLLYFSKYIVADGFYAKIKFVKGVLKCGFQLISKLREDANLNYLFEGEYKNNGRPNKYNGKVKMGDLSQFLFIEKLENGLMLYTKILYSVMLKSEIKVVAVVNINKKGKVSIAYLFSTDLYIGAKQIYQYYVSRFQIEFLFRDAKQFFGIEDCQSTNQRKLDFHFNISLTTLNLAKLECLEIQKNSMTDLKAQYFNERYVRIIFSKLDIDINLIKNHPNFSQVLDIGKVYFKSVA